MGLTDIPETLLRAHEHDPPPPVPENAALVPRPDVIVVTLHAEDTPQRDAFGCVVRYTAHVIARCCRDDARECGPQAQPDVSGTAASGNPEIGVVRAVDLAVAALRGMGWHVERGAVWGMWHVFCPNHHPRVECANPP